MADPISDSLVDVLTLMRITERDEPTAKELLHQTGWSLAKFKRVVAGARRLGIEIEVSGGPGVSGGTPRWRLLAHGPFDPELARQLYDQSWMPKPTPIRKRSSTK